MVLIQFYIIFKPEDKPMKISLANLDKIMERCTKKEIDLIIYIGQYQDEDGVIKGINYKDVINNIGISKSTFYKLLYSLEEKEIIKINYFNEHGFWEAQILDNVFATKEDYKKGYLKLNYEVLHSEDFYNLTKSEKLIVLHLLKINDFRREMIKVTVKKIMEWTNKSLRSVRKFILTLSNMFKIVKKDNLSLLIDCLFGFGTRETSESNIQIKHIIDYRLMKVGCQANENDIADTITVIKQFKIKCVNTMIQLIDSTINSFGTLVPRYTNKLVGLL